MTQVGLKHVAITLGVGLLAALGWKLAEAISPVTADFYTVWLWVSIATSALIVAMLHKSQKVSHGR